MNRIYSEKKRMEIEEWNHIRELNQKWKIEVQDNADTPESEDEEDDESDPARE